ncbi:XRE family transcriptional regulator [Streptomyces sp. MNP-20]|uniref:XRE family transcriptional regulator n=1 Tax=Streptomyces sp. MNP-20 TaxID=2721165 RepID=UPI00155624EE|nr:XRE family transcriptional regulator [Streptomyces sp. MNP-20]
MSTLLWHLMKSRHLQVYEAFAAQFEQAANELADRDRDPRLRGLSASKRTVERWWGGELKRQPQPDQSRVLEHMFRRPIAELLAEWKPPVEQDRLALSRGAEQPASVLLTDPRNPYADSDDMGRQVAMAADRALRFAVMAEGTRLGEETLAHIQGEIARIAADYPRVPLHSLLGDLIEVQDLAHRLLESGKAKPTQARDLYLQAAMAAGMLSKASHDLGDAHSAMAQARTAYICADQADHHPMRAWVRGLQSLISYWAGRPEDAVHYAKLGIHEAAQVTGTASTWLACLDARGHALLGDRDAVIDAISRAGDRRESTVHDDLDSIGGILTFPNPRHLYYVAEAEVLLGQHSAQVERNTEEAVRAYETAAQDEWAFGDEAGARTNLALSRIGSGELEGAAEAIRPVLDLPPAQRNHGIIVSARRVQDALVSPEHRTARLAKDLRTELEVFSSTPTPSLPR